MTAVPGGSTGRCSARASPWPSPALCCSGSAGSSAPTGSAAKSTSTSAGRAGGQAVGAWTEPSMGRTIMNAGASLSRVGPVLRTRGLEKEYGQGEGLVRALDGVALEVASGETLALMGPSGCGKSTLLHLLGGLERPSAGQVWLAGKRIDELSEKALARLR